jgi:iron complex outermembrane receptor protein
VVLSVSRLPQRLDDTPGAVTVIDREMIRMSGARDVADLMRFVPGFQVTNAFEADAPQASYHGAFGEYSNRLQVLVDGRSVYSPFLLGSVGPGLQSVALQDIERIEVLRGSNSAAYGARAFLGVINIVTRQPSDTIGWQASASAGENGVKDSLARLGWGTDAASFRVTVDERADDGLTGANGHNRVRRANLVADLRPTAQDDVQVRLGQLNIDSGAGFVGRPNRQAHDRSTSQSYLQVDWRRNLGEDADLAFSASHTEESVQDVFAFSLLPFGVNGSVPIDFGGKGSNDTVSLQHTFRNGNVRVVWGGELRREQTQSRPLYNIDAPLATDFSRLFGNAEWHMSPAWVLNVGGMLERSSVTGDSFAPRAMLNWHFSEGQTLRAGVSKAYRPPSTYENFSNVRYSYNGTSLQVVTAASGLVQPERVLAREIGYLADFPQAGVNLDVRLFHEQIGGFVRRQRNAAYVLPPGTVFPTAPFEYFNDEDFVIQGVEYQLKWRPRMGTQLVLSQAYSENYSKNTGTWLAAPHLSTSIMLMQKLPQGVELSLMHQESGDSTLPSSDERRSVSRTDLRLAKAFRLGANRAELSLTVQNLGSPYADFDPAFRFERRAFVTLRIEN